MAAALENQDMLKQEGADRDDAGERECRRARGTSALTGT